MHRSRRVRLAAVSAAALVVVASLSACDPGGTPAAGGDGEDCSVED